MRVVRVEREADGVVVCERCEIADGFSTRGRGLLGRRGLEPGHGLLIRPAASVHTFFMRFPIDCVFLDRELRVVAVREAVRPWRVAAARGSTSTLELQAGESSKAGLAPGVRVRLAELD